MAKKPHGIVLPVVIVDVGAAVDARVGELLQAALRLYAAQHSADVSDEQIARACNNVLGAADAFGESLAGYQRLAPAPVQSLSVDVTMKLRDGAQKKL
jgi:hypothetical protein